MNKVFLGGTCGKTSWRDELIKLLKIDYFNPIVDDWTNDCIKEEDRQKADLCNIHLYVITSEMRGVYSIAEAVQSSNTANKITIFHVIPDGFDKSELKSLQAVCRLIVKNRGIAYIFNGLTLTTDLLNSIYMENLLIYKETTKDNIDSKALTSRIFVTKESGNIFGNFVCTSDGTKIDVRTGKEVKNN